MLRTALIVDDSEPFRAYLREVLSRRGFEVLEAGDGDEGLRVALQKRPWLILTDVAMPRMNGIDFCRAVRRHTLIRHTPVVFLSGWDDFKERYAGMEAGGDDFVSKETPVRELLLRVQVLLNRYAALGRRDPDAVLEGRLEITGPSALLQMCHLSDLSGTLSVQSSGRCTEVRMSRGQIVSAGETSAGGPELSGPDVLFDLLSWTSGHFSFRPGSPIGEPMAPFTAMLLEGCRRLDERNRSLAEAGAEAEAEARS